MSYKTAVIDNCLNLLVVATLIVDGGMGVAAELITPSLEITWFSCPDRTLKIMSQIKFDFLNQLIARSAISLKIKYESQIKSLRKS